MVLTERGKPKWDFIIEKSKHLEEVVVIGVQGENLFKRLHIHVHHTGGGLALPKVVCEI